MGRPIGSPIPPGSPSRTGARTGTHFLCRWAFLTKRSASSNWPCKRPNSGARRNSPRSSGSTIRRGYWSEMRTDHQCLRLSPRNAGFRTPSAAEASSVGKQHQLQSRSELATRSEPADAISYPPPLVPEVARVACWVSHAAPAVGQQNPSAAAGKLTYGTATVPVALSATRLVRGPAEGQRRSRHKPAAWHQRRECEAERMGER